MVFTPTAAAAGLHAAHATLAAGEGSGAATGHGAGALMALRRLGGLAFGVILDATGRMQLLADEAVLGERWAPSPTWTRGIGWAPRARSSAPAGGS